MIRRIMKEFREIWPYPVLLALLTLPLIAFLQTRFNADSFLSAASAVSGRASHNVSNLDVKHIQEQISFLRYTCERMVTNYLGCSFLIQYLGLLLAAVALFGSEFKYGAIGRLLAQPVSRRQIWLEKTGAFALAALIVVAADQVVFSVAGHQIEALARAAGEVAHRAYANAGKSNVYTGFSAQSIISDISENNGQYRMIAMIYCVAALANGLTFPLFIRQPHTAFWAALTFPMFAYVVAMMLDFMVLKPMLHGSVFEALEYGWPHLAHGQFFEAGQGFNQLEKSAILWSLAVYALGWLKFKRLEV